MRWQAESLASLSGEYDRKCVGDCFVLVLGTLTISEETRTRTHCALPPTFNHTPLGERDRGKATGCAGLPASLARNLKYLTINKI